MKWKRPTSRQVFKFLAWFFLGVFCFYLIIGFLGVPFGLKWALRKKVPELLNARAYARRVRFNPFFYRLTVQGLEVTDNQDTRLISLDALDLDVSFVGLLKKTAHVETIELTGLYLHPVISSKGQLNFLSLLPEEKDPDASAADAAKAPEQKSAEAQKPLPVIVDVFKLNQGAVHLEDLSLRQPFDHVFRPINLALQNISTVMNAQSDFSGLVATLNGGSLSLDGHFQIEPFKLLLDVTLAGVPAKAVRAYLREYYALDVASGGVNLNGRMIYDASPDSAEVMTFKGGLNIPQLRLKDAARDEELLAWESLRVGPIDFSLSRNRLTIGTVAFDRLQGRVALESGGVNIVRVLSSPDAGPKPDGQTERTTALQPPASEAATPDAAKSFVFNLNELLVLDGELTFVDETATPAFSLDMTGLDLKVKGISTQKDSRVEYILTGQMQDKGELDVRGAVSPFVQPLALEVAFKLSNYDMTALSPYVGKFTGLAVGDGRLNLQLDYRIQNEELNAGHKVLMKKFDFGDKVESPDALNLPFNLALSLLKDVKGQVRIDVPVTGSLEDPQFKYLPLLGGALKNLLIKAVTKPFTLLASLVGAQGGEEDFSYIRFAPGSAQLAAAEKEKLLKIAQAFKERPGLGLEIHGVYDPQDDWWAIKTANFEREFAAMKQESTRTEERLLIQYYRAVFGIPAFGRLWAQYQAGLKNAVPEMTEAGFYAELRRQLIENAPADADALAQLAQARADEVYRIFTGEGGIEKARVRTGTAHEAQASLDTVPLELTLIANEQPGNN